MRSLYKQMNEIQQNPYSLFPEKYVKKPSMDYWNNLTIEEKHNHVKRVEHKLGLPENSIVSMEAI
jgi:hypothetical protein